MINPRTQRVHTSYNQAVTATGRLSSNNPNLQNIPVRTERGREIRKAFIPRNSDYILISADYSQIELRIIAHLSGDEAMKEAFRQGLDIHAATASRIFNIPLNQVTKEQRRTAKIGKLWNRLRNIGLWTFTNLDIFLKRKPQLL
jgi:DNA polymerase-1